jgi:transposase
MTKIKNIKSRIPKRCACPSCGLKQKTKINKIYYKRVKDINIDEEVILNVRMVNVKCSNSTCQRRTFNLPVEGISSLQRSTDRLRSEAIATVVSDNSTLPRTEARLTRSFNTTGSKSTIQRWIEKEADRHQFKDIIPKLGFSGILCIDEYWPRRSKTCDLISSDRNSYRILYIENIPHHYYEYAENHFKQLKGFGINPRAIIFDMWQPYPHTAEKVFPDALIQYDYFHVIKRVLFHIRRCLGHYMQDLKEQNKNELYKILWHNRFNIIKNSEGRTHEQNSWIQYINNRFKNTIVPEILIFKEKVRDIFINSESKQDALNKRNKLIEENWRKKDRHFGYVMKYLASDYQFNYMTTYLEHPEVPRAGNSETIVSIWRQMEAPRYGFKSNKGRQDHLKLYQLTKYLNLEI